MPRVHPLAALATQLLLGLLSEQGESTKTSPPSLPEVGEIAPVLGLKHKDGAVILILGRRESGKSVLAYRLAQVLSRPAFAISPEVRPPSWVREMGLDELGDIPGPMSTLVLDDAPVYMSQKDYRDKYVMSIERLIPVVRHRRKLILIFCSQSSGLTDKFAMDADLICMKPLSYLYADLERGAVKKLADTVMPIYHQKGDDWSKRHCFVFSNDWKGAVRIDKP